MLSPHQNLPHPLYLIRSRLHPLSYLPTSLACPRILTASVVLLLPLGIVCSVLLTSLFHQ
jgi:hypothetical protein